MADVKPKACASLSLDLRPLNDRNLCEVYKLCLTLSVLVRGKQVCAPVSAGIAKEWTFFLTAYKFLTATYYPNE